MSTKLNQAQLLTAIADFAEVFRTPDGETVYATIEVAEHKETWPVRSKGFRRWLVGRFYETERKPPGAQAVQDALGLLEARAQFSGVEHPVYVRVAEHSARLYLDLASPEWEAVEVTREGWRVVSDPPVKFRRTRGMLPLPRPVPSGSLNDLRRFVNVASEADWRLFVSLLVQALSPCGPYPVGIFQGDHGAAKSTGARIARELIDPNSAPLRAEPRDVRDVMIAATNGWLLPFDNLSRIPTWLSDVLCRLATGGGFSTRQLYTDEDEVLFDAQRPVLLNSIEEIATRSDLLDRAVILHLPAIPKDARRTERDLWADFRAVRPRVLGALLDAVASALRHRADVQLTSVPRMADYAVWVTAAETGLGWSAGSFLDAYSANRETANELALEASPVSALIQTLAEQDGEWTGTASELLAYLEGQANEKIKRAESWPQDGRALSNALRRLAANLCAAGVLVEFHDRPELKKRRRQIQIARQRSERSDRSGVHSQRSENATWNAETPRQNDPNGENGELAPLSAGQEEAEWTA